MKLRKTYSIDENVVDSIAERAKKEERSKSSIVNRALIKQLKLKGEKK